MDLANDHSGKSTSGRFIKSPTGKYCMERLKNMTVIKGLKKKDILF